MKNTVFVTSCNSFSGALRYLVNSGSNARNYAWCLEQSAAGRAIRLQVDDAIRVAKVNKFAGIVLFPERIHLVTVHQLNHIDKPVIRIDGIDAFDKVNAAIAAGQFFANGGDAHVSDSQKVGA